MDDGDEIILSSIRGLIVRTCIDTIRLCGRNSRGVRVMRLKPGDAVTSVSLVRKLDLPDGEGDADAPGPEENGENPEITPPADSAPGSITPDVAESRGEEEAQPSDSTDNL